MERNASLRERRKASTALGGDVRFIVVKDDQGNVKATKNSEPEAT